MDAGLGKSHIRRSKRQGIRRRIRLGMVLLGMVMLMGSIMMLPASTMKAKAAGNIIDGEITWTEITNGTHTGDYVGKNTTITECYDKNNWISFASDKDPMDRCGANNLDQTIPFNEIDKKFKIIYNLNPSTFIHNLTYNAFEILSDTYHHALIIKRVNITYPPQADSGSSDAQCDHDYEWTTVNEATEDYDGLEECRCTKCGAVCASRKIPKLSDNFNYVVEKETEKFVQAKSGQTIKIDLKDWNSIPKSFFEELAKRRDITTVIRFVYNHKVYEFMIARGQTVDTSVDYYGPEKLIQLYGAKEVQT